MELELAGPAWPVNPTAAVHPDTAAAAAFVASPFPLTATPNRVSNVPDASVDGGWYERML